MPALGKLREDRLLRVAMNNGDNLSRIDRVEKQLEKLGDLMADLIGHAESVDKQIERLGEGLEKLRVAQLSSDQGVNKLVDAIRDLIDRIPPENLRQGR